MEITVKAGKGENSKEIRIAVPDGRDLDDAISRHGDATVLHYFRAGVQVALQRKAHALLRKHTPEEVQQELDGKFPIPPEIDERRRMFHRLAQDVANLTLDEQAELAQTLVPHMPSPTGITLSNLLTAIVALPRKEFDELLRQVKARREKPGQ